MRVMTSKYSEDYRTDAVKLVERGDRTKREVAEDMGIENWTKT